MRNLVEIYNSNDLRWLLDVDILPENYDTEYLIPVLDDIIYEDEELTGNKFYTNFLKRTDIANKEPAKLICLRWAYEILLCNPLKTEEVKESLLLLKLKCDTLDSIDYEMKRITQQLQVKAMKAARKKKEKTNFGEMCAIISKRLDKVSIKEVRESTVAEFRGYQKIINEEAA